MSDNYHHTEQNACKPLLYCEQKKGFSLSAWLRAQPGRALSLGTQYWVHCSPSVAESCLQPGNLSSLDIGGLTSHDCEAETNDRQTGGLLE